VQPFLLSIRQAIDNAATEMDLTQPPSLSSNFNLAVKGFLQKYVGDDTVHNFSF
jgi:hypothetical protein